MGESQFVEADEKDPLDEIGTVECFTLMFALIYFPVSDFFRDRRHALALLTVCGAAVYLETLLLTNVIAVFLAAFGLTTILIANYGMSVAACEETRAEDLRGIFWQWRWWADEIRTVGIWLGAVALCVAGIWLAWYVPRGYTVNLAGVAGVFALVGVGVMISSYLGTKRAVRRRAIA